MGRSIISTRGGSSSSNGAQQRRPGPARAGHQTGTVKVWREEKCFGCLEANDGSGDAFMHRTALIEGKSLAPGTPVQYEAQWGPKHRDLKSDQGGGHRSCH